MDSRLHQTGVTLDYTAGATAVTAGTLVKIGGLVGVVVNDLAAYEKGSAIVYGVVAIRKKDEAIPAGLPVGWDDSGDPKVGTAGTGAATSLLNNCMAAADLFCGAAVYDAAAADEWVYVDLNRFTEAFPAWMNRYHIADTTGTMDNTDGGVVHRIQAADQTITLPEIATVAIGLEILIVVDTVDAAGATGLIVAPNANDGFNGFGYTHAVNKSLTNAEATAKRGDYLLLRSCGDTHWQVVEKRGTWTRAA